VSGQEREFLVRAQKNRKSGDSKTATDGYQVALGGFPYQSIADAYSSLRREAGHALSKSHDTPNRNKNSYARLSQVTVV